jgi:hypothetical protein
MDLVLRCPSNHASVRRQPDHLVQMDKNSVLRHTKYFQCCTSDHVTNMNGRLDYHRPTPRHADIVHYDLSSSSPDI